MMCLKENTAVQLPGLSGPQGLPRAQQLSLNSETPSPGGGARLLARGPPRTLGVGQRLVTSLKSLPKCLGARDRSVKLNWKNSYCDFMSQLTESARLAEPEQLGWAGGCLQDSTSDSSASGFRRSTPNVPSQRDRLAVL